MAINDSEGRPSVDEALKSAGFDMSMFEEPAPVPAATDPVVEPSETTVSEEPSTTEPAENKPIIPDPAPLADESDRRVQAMMAREAEVLRREQALGASRTEMAEAIRKEVLEQLSREFSINRNAVLRQIAPEEKPGSVAEDLWYEGLGDAAPAEWKAKKAERVAAATAAENARLKADYEAAAKRQQEEKAQHEAEEASRTYVASLQAHLSAVPDTQVRLKFLATQKPEKANGMMQDAARMLAQQTNKWPTPEEAAKAVEEYLEGLGLEVPAAKPAPTTEQPTASAPTTPTQTTTLRGSASAVQPSRVAPDPSDPKVLRRNALIAAGFSPDLMD